MRYADQARRYPHRSFSCIKSIHQGYHLHAERLPHWSQGLNFEALHATIASSCPVRYATRSELMSSCPMPFRDMPDIHKQICGSLFEKEQMEF